ncbi:MAG: hypothetical protein RLZZ488_1394 [Pseudomonadota bacterium]|jgi:hypothetical protein
MLTKLENKHASDKTSGHFKSDGWNMTRLKIERPGITTFAARLAAAIGALIVTLPTPSRASAAESDSVPFTREVSLLAGVSKATGGGVEQTPQFAGAFLYARSFAVPKAEHFLLRMIADTIWTQLKTSNSQPLAHLAAGRIARATLVRFGFSGCYVWSMSWMACMDDGPRISWLSQGNSDAQVLGSFPLGVSLHNADFFPWVLTLRGEYGRWDTRENGKQLNNQMSYAIFGAGYNW